MGLSPGCRSQGEEVIMGFLETGNTGNTTASVDSPEFRRR